VKKTRFIMILNGLLIIVGNITLLNSCTNDWLLEKHTSYSARIFNKSSEILFIVFTTSSSGTDTTVLVPKSLSSMGGNSYSIFYKSVDEANAPALTATQFRSNIISVNIYTINAGDTLIYHPELDLSDINLWDYYMNNDDFRIEHNYQLMVK